MRQIEFWAPAILCAGISLGTLIPIVILLDKDVSIFLSFLAFIPMCFYSIGTTMKKMNKEIVELREQIETLKKQNADI